MQTKTLLILLFTFQVVAGQVSTSTGIYFAKEYSKEIALYNAKKYVIENLFGDSKDAVRFEMDPLSAASSGELTSLVYVCSEKNKEGMVLGFYNDNWNNAGVIYSAYAFKNLPKEKAIKLLDEIDSLINNNNEYFFKDNNTNNVYFHFDDMTFLLFNNDNASTKIRVFWNGFDSEWDFTAFKRTKKRLQKKLN
ncbi:MAG: hypothetical protein ABI723_04380 [Bacteroidia bacterium]